MTHPAALRPSILQHASPRSDILKGELSDAMFAADFANVAEGTASKDYQDPETFFANTHPSSPLKQVVRTVFGVLNDPTRNGGVLQLSTGFGGGKSHTLITLYHLARNTQAATLGEDLLPSDLRPKEVRVVALDASRAGLPIYTIREGRELHSLWADVFWQLAGERGLQVLGDADDPEASPSEAQLDAVLPKTPVLFLLDELVIYMGKLSDRGRKNLMGFLNLLAVKCGSRPQTVMVITDPAAQQAYAVEADELTRQMEHATALDSLLGRKASDYDAIGNETAQVIVRRLFQHVDKEAAQAASKAYEQLYRRVQEENLAPLPEGASHHAARLAETWPLHPRLLDTIEHRLSALPGFQRGRGVLRLFARMLQAVYERGEDLTCITAGDLDWSHPRVQGELLERLSREGFKPAASVDVQGHAGELDGGKRGIHTRVASALLLESLPADDKSGLNAAETSLAVLRLDEAGTEPGEALDHLVGQCWHTYAMTATDGWQFRQQPNIVKQIAERVATISLEDARRRVLSEAKTFYSVPPSGDSLRFQATHFPAGPHLVPSKATLQLAVCERLETAKDIVELEDDRDGRRQPRLYRNAIVAVAPSPSAMEEAVGRARYMMAAEGLERANKDNSELNDRTRQQLTNLLTEYRRQFQLRTRRAFNQVVLPGGQVAALDEKYLVSEDEILQGQRVSGQDNISRFLRDTARIYMPQDHLDPDLLVRLLSGAVPQADGSYTLDAVHERLLGAPNLRLIEGRSVANNSVRQAAEQGRIAIRFADGSAYGLGQLVSGPAGERVASTTKPHLNPPAAGSNVAPAQSGIAQTWLKVDDPIHVPDDGGTGTGTGTGKGRGTPPPPPPPPPGQATASDWGTAKRHAQKRALKNISLTVTDAGGASAIQSLIPQLSATNVTVNVSVEGETADGEQVRLEFTRIRPNHQLKPLELARTLVRGTTRSSFTAEFRVTFDPPAPEATVQALAEKVPSNTSFNALFGEEQA